MEMSSAAWPGSVQDFTSAYGSLLSPLSGTGKVKHSFESCPSKRHFLIKKEPIQTRKDNENDVVSRQEWREHLWPLKKSAEQHDSFWVLERITLSWTKQHLKWLSILQSTSHLREGRENASFVLCSSAKTQFPSNDLWATGCPFC